MFFDDAVSQPFLFEAALFTLAPTSACVGMPFSLDSIPTAQKKRSAEESGAGGEAVSPQVEKKVRVSDIVIEQAGPRPQKTASRRPETAPWHICVYQVFFKHAPPP